jgi:uncharacterized protein with PIN domain
LHKSIKAGIRFYEELNNFLPGEKRKREFLCTFERGTTVKKLSEDLGVPHTEIDLVLVNGESVSFSYKLQQNDRISVYPVFEAFDVGSLSRVRPEPLRKTQFVLDVHLGKLATALRMMGFDACYSNRFTDEELVQLSVSEHRIILTRDRDLLKRKAVVHGYLVRSKDPVQQMTEVIRRFQLEKRIKPFSRCLECNTILKPADNDQITSQVPPYVQGKYKEFKNCPTCGRVYWQGTHWENMLERLNAIITKNELQL